MKHYLNGVEVAPRNVLEIGLITDYTGNPEMLQVDTDTIVLPREARDIIMQHVATQGVFEGIPYTLEVGNIQLDYYVDLTESFAIRDFEVEVKIKKRKGFDNFFENAEGLSFELMAKKGVNFNFINLPYLIIPENQVEIGLTLSLAIYSLTREAIQATRDLVSATEKLIRAVTPNVSLVPVPPLGEIIALSVAVVAKLAYTLAIYVALIKLARQLQELIFPKVRYYKGATIKELIKKGCEYLGYTLDSNLLNSWDKLTIMPVPLIKDKRSVFNFIQNDLNFSFTKGYPTAQDTVSTLGELINAVETWFNAKTKVFNGVVQIERRDYWKNITTNTTLPALNLQSDRQNEYRFNTEEAWKRTYIHYQVDYADTHTLDKFDPTDAEYSTEPLNVINEDLVSIRGFNDVNIPFALGVRKDELSYIEIFGRTFLQLADSIIGLFGVDLNFTSLITDRLGVTQISSQFFGVTKVLYAVNGRQPKNYVDKIKASNIYNLYHKINEINVNGFKVYNDAPMRLNPQEFISLLDNNFAYINGALCEILTVRFTDEQSQAVISYREPFNYAEGKVEILTIND
jgi:hypothetical protein